MQVKKIVIASDHGGYSLKTKLVDYLKQKGCEVLDFGPSSMDIPVDYPDKAYMVAKGIQNHEGDIGILICRSGIGMSIAVNRYPFIRGALVTNEELAQLARSHNNANVLIFGEKIVSEETAKACVDIFLSTPFDAGRHEIRVKKLGEPPHEC